MTDYCIIDSMSRLFEAVEKKSYICLETFFTQCIE